MDYMPAGLSRRLGAFALDMVPILGYILLLLAIFAGIPIGIFHIPLTLKLNPILSDTVAFATIVLPVILYFAIQESSPRQTTWGKRRMGLWVITKDGKRLRFFRSLIRSIVKFLPWQIAHTCIFHIPGWPFDVQGFPTWVMAGFIIVYTLIIIYLITITFTPNHQSVYDFIAGSFVVKAEG